MPSRASASRIGRAGLAIQVAGSQFALAGSNYVLLALAARQLDPAGFAAISSYYLLINTVGRGLFAAVELETTRSVARAVALDADTRAARATARRHTGLLLAGALVLLLACSPLLGAALGSAPWALGLLAMGALTMAASYLVRGPLAGIGRYPRYAATFWLEAGAGLAAALLLVSTGNTDTPAWIAVLALAPLAAVLVLVRRPGTDLSPGPRPGDDAAATDHGIDHGIDHGEQPNRVPELLWSAALLMAGQGVWNLAPVVVAARMADSAAVATGFVTVAMIMRAPVLLFPSVQAFLLPAATRLLATGEAGELRRLTRRLGLLLALAGAAWLLLAGTVVPVIARVVFATTSTPPLWMLLVLAVSIVLGTFTQIAQTHLVAARRQRAVALSWIGGLAVLLGLALLAPDPEAGASWGQLAAAAVVLLALYAARRRLDTTGTTTNPTTTNGATS